MKLTIIRTDKQNRMHLSTKSLDAFMERIQQDTKAGDVTLFRQRTAYGVEVITRENENLLPKVYPLALMRKTDNGQLDIMELNALTMIRVTNLSTASEVEAVKQTAALMPTTIAAFADSTARGVIVLVGVKNGQSDTMPQTQVEQQAFVSQAHRLAIAVYSGLLPATVATDELSPRSSFRMTLDPHPYYNPKAHPITVTALPQVEAAGDDATWDSYENYEHIYNIAVDKTLTALGDQGADDHAYLTELSRQMCVMGVPEEETFTHIWHHYGFRFGADRNLLRTILQAVFQENSPNRQAVKQASDSVGIETRRIIDFLNSRYIFRYNEVMGYTEYRPNNKWVQPWQPCDDRAVKGITTEARLAGINAWDRDIVRYVQSDQVRTYNPIERYLWEVSGKWDGYDHIGRLAKTVPCTEKQWPQWFRKWLIYMVAQWLGRTRGYGNSVAPLLISRQGYNKSTFCRSLLPPELQWGYTDNLAIEDKRQTLQAMHNMLLINLDEFNQITPRIQQGFLKNIFQLASVKMKRPYGRHVEDFPRRASFIATTNMPDVLADPSGSRRFIGIQLTGPIDVNYRINYQQLYAQAIQALDDNEQYWFDDNEVRQIMEHNRQFQIQSPVEQYFAECFLPVSDETEGEWLTCAAILDVLRRRAGSSLRNPSPIVLGRILRQKDDLLCRRSNTGTQYLVKRLL